jgi:small-conductance mechanosensitive channel
MSSMKADIEAGITNEETPLVNPEDNDNKLEEIPEWTPLEIAISGTAVATAATSVAAMVANGNPLTVASGTLGIVVPSYSAIQQQKITETLALKETNEFLENELNNLKIENNRLSESCKQLEGSVANLEDMEEALANIRQMETQNLDLLEEQIVESQEILDSMEKNVMGTVIQNIMSILFAIDTDGDYKLSDDEIDTLIHKVEAINDVDVNDEMIKKLIIEKDRNIDGVMDVIRDMLEDSSDKPPEERCFRFNDQN